MHLGLEFREKREQAALVIRQAAADLLLRLSRLNSVEQEQARNLAIFLMRAGWRWAPAVLTIFGRTRTQDQPDGSTGDLAQASGVGG